MSSEAPVFPREISLKDAVEFIVDNRGRTAPTEPHGIALIATNCVNNVDLYPLKLNLRYVSQETYNTWFRSHPMPGDILLTNKGSQNGAICLVPNPVDFCIAQDMVALRADRTKISPLYLFAALRSDLVQKRIKALNVDAVIPHLKKTDFNKLLIPLPDRETQDSVGEFYFELSRRIELLRETNATLEAIAQALFKSWFVDFDPVRAKMEGRAAEGMDEATAALFPDSFEESELGLVPRGWRVMPLGDLCAVTIGGLWGSDERDDAELTPAISLRGVDLEHLRADGFAKNAPRRWVRPSAMDKRRLGENEVLIASSGAGPCGRTIWAGAGFELLYGMPVIFSNFVKRLDCGSPARAIYIDRLLAEMRETREIWNYINGTSIPNLDDKLLLATKKVVIPEAATLSAFEVVARTIYKRLYSQQAQTLANLRDTLLPRLISGQLRLNEIGDEN